MPGPINSILDLDGDKVTITVRGKTAEIYAADFVDSVISLVRRMDNDSPLPETQDPETLDIKPGTHGNGIPFTNILRQILRADYGLEVLPRVAVAIWIAMNKRADEYRESFVNGGSSAESTDSPHPQSSADAAVSGLLSQSEGNSKPQSDSTH